MNALSPNRTGYSGQEASLRPSRRVEYDALAYVTRQLTIASREQKRNSADFVKSLNENLMLWSTFAEDVVNSENLLPKETRAQIFYLFEFTRQQTHSILDGNSDVQPLIDINMSIMRGLRGQGGDQ